jgi:hypothetical protein
MWEHGMATAHIRVEKRGWCSRCAGHQRLDHHLATLTGPLKGALGRGGCTPGTPGLL